MERQANPKLMATLTQSIKQFKSGTHNLNPDEIIPRDAASSSTNWITQNGEIILAYGRQLVGAAGAAGKNYGEHTAYRADGTAVRFRKVASKIQYLNGTTWTDVITGLTVAADYTFSNYQSLAGAFVYIFGVDGIYKIAVANPASYTSLYDSTKNFKGYGFIDKGRSIMWGFATDKSGLRGSWIDNQLAVSGSTGVYTAVSAEALADVSVGTLAFKAGGSTRTCFGVTITVTGTGEVLTDDYNGVLTGNMGSTGTINYTTGAFTSTASGAGTADYQWENSNLRGVTDMTHSATRLAGEGFVIRQDAGGDAIVTVLPLAGSYFSLKQHSAYQFTLDTTDLAPTNVIFRTDIGVLSLRSATATGAGILFINTANPSQPTVQLLTQNPLGDNFDVKPLFSQYDFSQFTYDDALVDNWDRFLVIGCKSANVSENDTLLLCDFTTNTVDKTSYGIRSSTKLNGILYGGDPLSQSTYELFTGFDDIGVALTNEWVSRGETFGADVLKKVKRRRYKGYIDPAQTVQVYESYDDGDPTLIGTILGSGAYVDYTASHAIGTVMNGEGTIGGGNQVTIYPFFIEIKVRALKFRKRKVSFVATGIGYVSINMIEDFDIWTYQNKMPARYRSKQNVALDGATVDMSDPDY